MGCSIRASIADNAGVIGRRCVNSQFRDTIAMVECFASRKQSFFPYNTKIERLGVPLKPRIRTLTTCWVFASSQKWLGYCVRLCRNWRCYRSQRIVLNLPETRPPLVVSPSETQNLISITPRRVRFHDFVRHQLLIRLAAANQTVRAAIHQNLRSAGPGVVIAAHGRSISPRAIRADQVPAGQFRAATAVWRVRLPIRTPAPRRPPAHTREFRPR